MTLRPLLLPLLCQLKGKVLPAAQDHTRFLIAATKLQEGTAVVISLLGGGRGKTGLATAAGAPCPPLLSLELAPCYLLLWALWLLLPWQGRQRHQVGLAQPSPLTGFVPDPLAPQLFWSQHSRACAGRNRIFSRVWLLLPFPQGQGARRREGRAAGTSSGVCVSLLQASSV